MKIILLNKFQDLKKWSFKNEIELKKVSEKIELQKHKIKDLKSNQHQRLSLIQHRKSLPDKLF